MSINFNQLKRKEVRKTIKTSDFEHPVLVFNPNDEQRTYIMNLIIKSIDTETNVMNVSSKDVLLKLIPMLTNIEFTYDMDKEEDRQIVESIINDPSELLLQVIEEIGDIMKEFVNHTMKNAKNLSELSDEELKTFMKQFSEVKETPEEKRIRELEEELQKLKNKGE